MAELTVELDAKTCEGLKRRYPGMSLEQAAAAALSMAIRLREHRPKEALKRCPKTVKR